MALPIPFIELPLCCGDCYSATSVLLLLQRHQEFAVGEAQTGPVQWVQVAELAAVVGNGGRQRFLALSHEPGYKPEPAAVKGANLSPRLGEFSSGWPSSLPGILQQQSLGEVTDSINTMGVLEKTKQTPRLFWDSKELNMAIKSE